MKTHYQPKNGQPCHCKPGIYRDNCPDCEGTGQKIDFAAIRARKVAPSPHHNTQCDGSGPCLPGEVRTLRMDDSLHGSNAILCRRCFGFEIEFRKDRNRDLPHDCRFSLPLWEDLAIYNPNAGITQPFPTGRW